MVFSNATLIVLLIKEPMFFFIEGHAAASTYDSKYIGVSATLNHKIDDLLVGVLKQIRLVKQKYDKTKASHKHSGHGNNSSLLKAREKVLAKIFKNPKSSSSSCDNLYVL